jgi:hypothetical protein
MELQTLTKQPSESRAYDMDFRGILDDGVTVASVTSFTASPTTVPALTITGTAFAGTVVQRQIAAGANDTMYKVTCIIVDSQGNTIEGEGYLYVKDL